MFIGRTALASMPTSRRLALILPPSAELRLMSTDGKALRAPMAHRREVDQIAEYRGRIAKTTGDGLLANSEHRRRGAVRSTRRRW